MTPQSQGLLAPLWRVRDHRCISPSAAGAFWVINTRETSEDGQTTGDEHMNLAATWKEAAIALWQGYELAYKVLANTVLAWLRNCFLVVQDHSKCFPWHIYLPNTHTCTHAHTHSTINLFVKCLMLVAEVPSGQTKRNKNASLPNAYVSSSL